MSFTQILLDCDYDILTILGLVKWGVNLVCWVTPVILIILSTVDVAKIVTAGNLDEKMKKEVGNKLITRIIYAVVIFMIPIIVSFIFRILPKSVQESTNAGDASWWECWKEA